MLQDPCQAENPRRRIDGQQALHFVRSGRRTPQGTRSVANTSRGIQDMGVSKRIATRYSGLASHRVETRASGAEQPVPTNPCAPRLLLLRHPRQLLRKIPHCGVFRTGSRIGQRYRATVGEDRASDVGRSEEENHLRARKSGRASPWLARWEGNSTVAIIFNCPSASRISVCCS